MKKHSTQIDIILDHLHRIHHFHVQTPSSAGRLSITPGIVIKLSVVGGGGNVATPSCPVDVDVLALLVLLVGEFGLDAEGVGTEVVTLIREKKVI